MSVEEEQASKLLPESDSVLDAFKQVMQQHPRMDSSLPDLMRLPRDSIAPVVTNFFFAGLAFLANKGYDDYIQEVGTVAWWWTHEALVTPLITPDMVEASARMGASDQTIANAIATKPFGPHVFLGVKRDGPIISENAYIITPVSFISRAQTQPIEALATLAQAGSEIRDFANGIAIIDPDNIDIRADATGTHFLKGVIEKHPDVGLSPYFWNLLTNYPDGIYSLPREARYKGGSGKEFMAQQNN